MTPRRGNHHKSKRNMRGEENFNLRTFLVIADIISLCILVVGIPYLVRDVPLLKGIKSEEAVSITETGESHSLTVSQLNLNHGSDILSDLIDEGYFKQTVERATSKGLPSYEEIVEEEEEPTFEKMLEDLPFDETGYVTANVLNVREEPNTDAEIKDIITYNKPVSYSTINDEWGAVKMEDEEEGECIYFISLKYITDEEMPYEFKEVSGDRRKSFLDYKSITMKTSKQYKIQKRYAETDPETGIRKVDNKYCIALGSYFSHNVGQYVDLVLENGETIPCVIGDAKSNLDTNENNSIGKDGSVSEFITDKEYIDHSVKRSGDISDVNPNWNSKVIGVKLYDKSLFQW